MFVYGFPLPLSLALQASSESASTVIRLLKFYTLLSGSHDPVSTLKLDSLHVETS